MSRVVEHRNTASNGPVGIEYLLPTDSNRFDGWLAQFVDKATSDIAATVRETWSSTIPWVQAISSGLEVYNPRSLYHLPCEWSATKDWLLFETERHVMYVPEPSETMTAVGVDAKLVELVRCFDGYRFGYNPHPEDDFLRCDSGFEKLRDLKPILRTDEEYIWEDDETVLEGCWFFTTSCGNRLYLRQDGTIAKWNQGNCEINNAFDSLDDFASSFVELYAIGRSDERSPLFY